MHPTHPHAHGNACTQVGLPLTCAQFDRMTPEVVIDRLVNRHQHKMALLLCDYLKIDKDRVLVHWACAKVRARSTATANARCVCGGCMDESLPTL